MTMLNSKREAESFTKVLELARIRRRAALINMGASESSQTSTDLRGGEMPFLGIERSTSKIDLVLLHSM